MREGGHGYRRLGVSRHHRGARGIPRSPSTTGLVVLRNRFKNAFAQIDVQLSPLRPDSETWSRRLRATSSTQRETLEAVTKARHVALAASQAAAANPATRPAMQQPRPGGGRADRSARAPARGRRVLPGPQGEPEHARAAGGAPITESGTPSRERRNDSVLVSSSCSESMFWFALRSG